jgi:hypothetical protein
MKILLSPDAGDGGEPALPQPPAPGETHTPNPPQPAPPPAATAVLTGTKSERELQLEAELENLKKEKKLREIEAAELIDENHRLKFATKETPPAAPADQPWKYRPIKRSQ